MSRLTRFSMLMLCLMLLIPVMGVFAQDEGPAADLDAIKTYLLGKTAELKEATTSLQEASQAYYDLAEAAGFDYAALWENEAEAVSAALEDAKAAWIA